MPTPHLDSRVLFPLEGGGLPYQLHRGFGVSSAGKVTFRYMDPAPRALNALPVGKHSTQAQYVRRGHPVTNGTMPAY